MKNTTVGKLLILSALFGASVTANAAPITYNGYSWDDTENYVTVSGSNLQWLRWAETDGQSINEALASNNGYRLASNAEMASLFTDFFPLGGSGTWGGDETVWYQESLAYADGDADAEAFQSLFGQTKDEDCSSGGGRDWVDCINFSTALYGSDLDGNGQYNVAEVRDRHSWINTYATPDELEERGANMLLYSQQQSGGKWAASNVDRHIAVALVRNIPAPVSEPATLSLLSLGLAGLGFARRQRLR